MNRTLALWAALLLSMSGCANEPLAVQGATLQRDADDHPDGEDDGDDDDDEERDRWGRRGIRLVPEELQTVDPESCLSLSGISPVPGEDGHLLAVRIPNDDGPFLVREITYSLIDRAGIPFCDSSLPHELSVWTQFRDAPDPTPRRRFRQLQTPTPTPGAPNNFYTVTLPRPILLWPRQNLFISLEQVLQDDGTATCVLACDQAEPGPPGFGFWSNSDTEPYPWADLVSDFGLTSPPIFFVDGDRIRFRRRHR